MSYFEIGIIWIMFVLRGNQKANAKSMAKTKYIGTSKLHTTHALSPKG
jgi:hypothetical protein